MLSEPRFSWGPLGPSSSMTNKTTPLGPFTNRVRKAPTNTASFGASEPRF